MSNRKVRLISLTGFQSPSTFHQRVPFNLLIPFQLIYKTLPGASLVMRLNQRIHNMHTRWLVLFALLALSTAVQCGAAEVTVTMFGRSGPENLSIYVGDTVIFSAASTTFTESYTGEWKSPVLKVGQTFSHTFTQPGTNVYRVGSYSDAAGTDLQGYSPGTITILPWTNSRPIISIVTPVDGFVTPGGALIEAVTTLEQSDVKAVHFFVGNQLFDTVTNAPYQAICGATVPADNLGIYEITASVIDVTGRTNTSPPVHVSVGSGVFKMWRLPQGQSVIFYSEPGPPSCAQWSDDLKTWQGRYFHQPVGAETFIDERATNSAHRFYRVISCL